MTTSQVEVALNRAADDIAAALDLPDTGQRDLLNLMVNTTALYLDAPDAAFEDVADMYDHDPDDGIDGILDWARH